jgi:ketosteroid isomerase-like protein
VNGENVGRARALVDAWARGDFDTVLDGCTPDIELDATEFLGGIHVGQDAVREYWEQVFETVRFVHERLEFLAAGDEVYVLARVRLRGAESGAEVEGDWAYVLTFEDGIVHRARFSREHETARRRYSSRTA